MMVMKRVCGYIVSDTLGQDGLMNAHIQIGLHSAKYTFFVFLEK